MHKGVHPTSFHELHIKCESCMWLVSHRLATPALVSEGILAPTDSAELFIQHVQQDMC